MIFLKRVRFWCMLIMIIYACDRNKDYFLGYTIAYSGHNYEGWGLIS